MASTFASFSFGEVLSFPAPAFCGDIGTILLIRRHAAAPDDARRKHCCVAGIQGIRARRPGTDIDNVVVVVVPQEINGKKTIPENGVQRDAR